MKAILTTVLLAVVCALSAQSNVFDAKITSGGLIVSVEVAPGHTIYGLSKVFGTSVADIMSRSSRSNSALSIGDRLKLKLDPGKITTSYRSLEKPQAINITTTKGDNLYRISKATGLTPDQILSINGKEDNSLRIGETLLVGWIEYPYGPEITDLLDTNILNTPSTSFKSQSTSAEDINVPKQETTIRSALHGKVNIAMLPIVPYVPYSAHNRSFSEYQLTHVIPGEVRDIEEIKKEKGIAYWEKTNYAQTDLVVMHPTAKVNSKISLYNPMMKRKVEAKVVGEMPEESYSDDVSVVISPSVANALGALDRRFLVEITYVE